MGWAEEEFGRIDLGDARLDKRMVLLAERLAQKPGQSIPNACANWTETAAAYRFLSNEQVDGSQVLEAHERSTCERMRQHRVVLCLQDTTELDFDGRAMKGLGPLSYEAQRGMYVHPTYAVTVEREPLGLLGSWNWTREFKDAEGHRPGMLESLRWIEGYERIAERAQEMSGTRLICVGDRESDILALMVKARDMQYPADYLLRSQHDRCLPQRGKLWSRVMESKPLGRVGFEIPAGRGRKARHVEQELRVQRVALADGKGGKVEVTCVIAAEVAAPSAAKPVVWKLLTNREVDTLQQAAELVDWYRARWEIELFFLVLKEGCRIERSQLSSVDRIEVALALYMVIAWRINRLMRLGRTLPDLPADLLFEPDEWRAAFILNKKPAPTQVPPLNTVLRLIARRGGFLARKHDGEPGVKTIWLGMHEIAVFVEGVRFAREFGSSGLV